MNIYIFYVIYTYSSPNTVRVIKSRRMIWAGHLEGMGERRSVYRVLVGNLRERDHLEDPSVNGRIMLRWMFRKWDVRAWTGLIRLRIGTGVNAVMNLRFP
jgi:hypothetical protein